MGKDGVWRASGGEVQEVLGTGLGWLSLEGPWQGAQEGRLVVAEPLFSQQPWKLWIMSLACWVNRHSGAVGSDVCMVWAAGPRSGGQAGVGEVGGLRGFQYQGWRKLRGLNCQDREVEALRRDSSQPRVCWGSQAALAQPSLFPEQWSRARHCRAASLERAPLPTDPRKFRGYLQLQDSWKWAVGRWREGQV